MEILPTERSINYALELDGEIKHTGVTPVGAMTATTLIAHTDASEGTFLEKVIPFAAQFPILPELGTRLERGDIYRYEDTLVQVRQSHNRTEHVPANVINLFFTVRENPNEILEWIWPERVQAGMIRIFEGAAYRVRKGQGHTTQSDWTPPVATTLWEPWTPPVVGGTWQDSGETITQLYGNLVFGVTDTAPFPAGTKLRIQNIETDVDRIHQAGAPGIIVCTVHIDVVNGDAIEIWR